MGPLQYAHIRFMWNRKIFLISLPQQNTNFETSTRARGISCKKFCNCVRPVRTQWRGVPWNCSLHETEWWWCVDYRRICAQDALWQCFMRVHQSHVSGVINRVTWHLMLCWWLSRRSESGLCLIFCDKYARVASKLSDGVCCWQDKVGVIQRRYLIAARLQQWLLNLSDVRNWFREALMAKKFHYQRMNAPAMAVW